MITKGAKNYTQIGFDKFGTKKFIYKKGVSANEMDAFYEVAIQMIKEKNIANLAVTSVKIDSLAVTDEKIAKLAVMDGKINDVSAGKFTAGTLAALVALGVSNILIDGVNKRIIINDGTNDRVLIGYYASLF